jgi:phosphoglycolate phosphatase-like HAD superfamily hydrolase
MLLLDDTNLPDRIGNLEIVRRVGRRTITHVFHDIDGTHSLIREWPPVMSALISWVIARGLPNGYDSDDNARRLAERVESLRSEETDRFAVDTAGLTALTQMEWAIRRALQEGTLALPGGLLSEPEVTANSEIIRRTCNGEERFGDVPDSRRVREYVSAHTPRLFHLYEAVLAKASRDRNLAAATRDPAAWRVPGSLEFLQRLHAAGAKNHFVTGSVMSTDQLPEGMLEEVLTLGFEVGRGKVIESAHGSAWNRKMPKDEVMRALLSDLEIAGEQVLIVGDGRSEVHAGVEMGAAVLSRLPADADRLRQLHRELGTNYIVADYTDPGLSRLLEADDDG